MFEIYNQIGTQFQLVTKIDSRNQKQIRFSNFRGLFEIFWSKL